MIDCGLKKKNLTVLEEKVDNYVTVGQTFTYTITHNGPTAISFRKLSLMIQLEELKSPDFKRLCLRSGF